MATVAIKSAAITSRDAVPRVLSNASIVKGMLVETVGTLETTASDSIGSTYRLCSIPSNARVSQVIIRCDSLGTAGAADIGIYQTTDNGGAVVDADHFASAQSLVTEIKIGTDITHEAGVYGLEDLEKPLWNALGLSADSKRDYDVVATLTTATIDAGSLALVVRYVI